MLQLCVSLLSLTHQCNTVLVWHALHGDTCIDQSTRLEATPEQASRLNSGIVQTAVTGNKAPSSDMYASGKLATYCLHTDCVANTLYPSMEA